MTFRYLNEIRLGDDFRYVKKIRPGDVFQILGDDFKQNSTWRCTFRYVNKIRLGDDFQILKRNSTWR